MSDLKQRRRRPERMDNPALEPIMHQEALTGLARINRLSLCVDRIWEPIAALATDLPQKPIKVLDIATGGGDIPIGLWRRARQACLEIELTACDSSERALDFARKRAESQRASVKFMQLDVLRDALPSGFDVVTCSLFLHHLEESQVIALICGMAQAARHMVVISDLDRSRISYAMTRVLTRLLTRSPVVHNDGPLSVAGAFTMHEARDLARQAGLHDALVRRIFPWRWRMVWRRELTR